MTAQLLVSRWIRGGVMTVLCVVVGLGALGTRATAKEREDDEKLKRTALLTGAGQGTFGSDLDDDGATDGSYFGVAVHEVQRGKRSSVEGHFICAMWGNTRFLGLTLMGVEGRVTKAIVDERTQTVWLSGIGTVDLGMGPSGFFTDVPFRVRITPGGPGVGSIKLSVIGAFDGVPGDSEVGNGNYDLPVERVLSGHIQVF